MNFMTGWDSSVLIVIFFLLIFMMDFVVFIYFLNVSSLGLPLREWKSGI